MPSLPQALTGPSAKTAQSKKFGPGDVIWCPPNQRHWHGPTPTTSMTHIAIQEALDGKSVNWMEKVTDEQYLVDPPKRGN